MQEKVYGYWLPIDISTHGATVDWLINWLHVFMLALFLGWGVFFVYCLVRYRRRTNPAATYDPVKGKLAKYVEYGVIVVEAVLLVGLSMPLWADFKHAFPDESDALVVRVVPEQFAWNIHYSGKDGIFGRSAPQFVSADNLLGLDPDDPNGNDDFNAINNLHIVKDKPVIAHLSSKDVIHSFKIPVMRLTQDAIPGQDIKIWFEATRTGTFDIACAQLCGLGHYRMRGQLTIESEAVFQAWFDEQSGAADEEDEFSF
jgi:cytochrome c oxidase subunit 2